MSTLTKKFSAISTLDAVHQRQSDRGFGNVQFFCLPNYGFARSLGEFGATITFVGNIAGVTRTLPLALYGYTQIPGGEGLALRLMSLSIALALMAVMASEFVNRYYSRRLHGR